MTSKKIFASLKIIILAFILAVGIQYLHAFDAAPANPPTCPSTTAGCNSPLNVSNTYQIKGGPLILNATSGSTTGLMVAGQSVFNTAGVVSSAIQIIDGSQGVGKVLTSDANGNGTWQTAGGTSNNPVNFYTEIFPSAGGSLANGTTNLGTWTYCSLGGTQVGNNTSIGNKYITVESNSTVTHGNGTWSVINNAPNDAHQTAICLGVQAPLSVSSMSCSVTPSGNNVWTFTGSPSGGLGVYSYLLQEPSYGMPGIYFPMTIPASDVPGSIGSGQFYGLYASGSYLQVQTTDGQSANVYCSG